MKKLILISFTIIISFFYSKSYAQKFVVYNLELKSMIKIKENMFDITNINTFRTNMNKLLNSKPYKNELKSVNYLIHSYGLNNRIEIPISDDPFNTSIEQGKSQEYSIYSASPGGQVAKYGVGLDGNGYEYFDILPENLLPIAVVPGVGTLYDVWFTISAKQNAPITTYTFKLVTVLLDASNNVIGGSVKDIVNITVTNPSGGPIADFTATPTSGTAPLTVQFTDQSTGTITSRSWDFGDGQTSTSTNPSHTYQNAGTYTVKLTVTGPGGSNTKTRSSYISVSSSSAPVANFSGTPTSGTAPLTVQFTDQSTGTITSRSWDFGDGQTSTSTNPSHTYQNAGTYTVKLTVTGTGGSNTKTRSNYISVSSTSAPVANFYGTPTSGTAPLTVQFTDQSTGNITSRSWDFGDGQTSTATNPSHTYQNAGTYTVKLTVTGTGGANTKTRNNYINVSGSQAYFSDIGANIKALRSGSTQWGDYDNDGDLDILMTGLDKNGTYFSKIYKNQNNTFVDANANIPPVAYGNTCWGDYDNDGDLDILLCGWDGSIDLLRIYQNNNGSFSKANVNLTGLGYQEASWADVDNDGDLDILVTGLNSSSIAKSILYINNGNNNFTYRDLNLSRNLYDGSITWGDYDNDGDQDLVITGRTSSSLYSIIYRNDGNLKFTDIQANLQGVYLWSCAQFGDYDNDGDLDIVLTGAGSISNSSTRYTLLYKNNGNDKFVNVNVGLKPSKQGSIMWGDYDNDGDLDIFLSGFDGYNDHTKLYRNDGIESFTLLPDNFPDAVGGCAWGDYDNDGDLDLIIEGWNGYAESYFGAIYKNNGANTNTKPNPPANLQSYFQDGILTMSWQAASDNETPSQSLSYNIRVGTTPGGNDIFSACSNLNGYRMLSELGNVQMNKSWTISKLANNVKYYWAVQAIDGCFSGSEWTEAELTTLVENEKTKVPLKFSLLQNYPNPFNSGTKIEFEIPVKKSISLKIYNISGRLVSTLISNEEFDAGLHGIYWNGKNEKGQNVSTGIYIYRLRFGNFSVLKRMAYIR